MAVTRLLDNGVFDGIDVSKLQMFFPETGALIENIAKASRFCVDQNVLEQMRQLIELFASHSNDRGRLDELREMVADTYSIHAMRA